jgi:dTDP-4-dehydrorhamnose 3,5-epimerase
VTNDAWNPTEIDGVLRRHQVAIGDDRGSFTEIWRDSLTAELLGDGERFVQANLSRSRAGVLRGMHFHRHQVDLWILLEGRALAATTDLRALAVSGGEARSQVLALEPGDALFIPRLVAHGFWALEDVALLYLVSNEYDGTDELGFAWDDPAAGVTWPGSDPIVSDRDQRNPRLTDVAAALSES